MLGLRILSAAVGIPIILTFLFLGKVTFFLLITSLSLLGIIEFYRLFKTNRPEILLGLSGGLFLTMASFLRGERGLLEALVIILFLGLIWPLFSPLKLSLSSTALTLLGPLYVAFLFSHLILLQNLGRHGSYLVLLVLLATWVGDIFAYALGSLWGRRKLSPRISPGKTWEGVIFGALASILVLILLPLPWLSLEKRGLLGLTVGAFSPLGDLVESYFKREARVKDSGFLIPGHGGILDRFDSLLFTGPASYYLLKFLL